MTNKKIELIIELLKQRKLIDAKNHIRNLDEDLSNLENLQEFYNDIDKMCRELGKTNMIHKEEIEELLQEYKTVKGGERNDN